MTDPLFKFLEKKFGITLEIWHHIAVKDQDKSVEKIVPILNDLDIVTLNSLF